MLWVLWVRKIDKHNRCEGMRCEIPVVQANDGYYWAALTRFVCSKSNCSASATKSIISNTYTWLDYYYEAFVLFSLSRMKNVNTGCGARPTLTTHSRHTTRISSIHICSSWSVWNDTRVGTETEKKKTQIYIYIRLWLASDDKPPNRDNIYASSRRRCLMTVKHTTHAAKTINYREKSPAESDESLPIVYVWADFHCSGTVCQAIYYKMNCWYEQRHWMIVYDRADVIFIFFFFAVFACFLLQLCVVAVHTHTSHGENGEGVDRRVISARPSSYAVSLNNVCAVQMQRHSVNCFHTQ